MSETTKGAMGRLWQRLRRPSQIALGTLLGVGFISGILFWGGFNTAMEATNTEAFCLSCHEMRENVYKEYQNTIHYSNRSGVRAVCSDCHVPQEWHHKMVRKIQASNEVLHKILGTINTPEKFEEHRLRMAQNVWRSMKATDSRECRNCHEFDSMDYTRQQMRAVSQHIQGFDEGKTCIDCHKGIAHSLPAMYEVDPSAAMGPNRP
jgi:cytochrome c-type protein NapC